MYRYDIFHEISYWIVPKLVAHSMVVVISEAILQIMWAEVEAFGYI
jgi:hypothetical protein